MNCNSFYYSKQYCNKFASKINNIWDIQSFLGSFSRVYHKNIRFPRKRVGFFIDPPCGFRMHSRGIKTRSIRHPILQDGYELILLLRQRRWRCTNPDCRYETNDSFRFVDRSRRTTNASDMLIIFAFRNLNESAASIARRFNTSDTHVLDVFDRYVNFRNSGQPLRASTEIEEIIDEYFHSGDSIFVDFAHLLPLSKRHFAR